MPLSNSSGYVAETACERSAACTLCREHRRYFETAVSSVKLRRTVRFFHHVEGSIVACEDQAVLANVRWGTYG